MRALKAFYEVSLEKHEELIEALENHFSLKPTYSENYISMRGNKDSGIETVRMSLEKDAIKILVVLYDRELLDKFNNILGTPSKVKGML